MPKTHRLKEPTTAEVTTSVGAIVRTAARLVYKDHRGDVAEAELVMLSKVYLQRAIDALGTKDAKATCVRHVVGNETVH